MRIVFKNLDNSIAIITPTQEALDLYGIEAIAKKDVPAPYQYPIEWEEQEIEGEVDPDGQPLMHSVAVKFETYYTPFKIVEDDVIPTDREFRNAWTIDDAELTDGVGGELNTFEELA